MNADVCMSVCTIGVYQSNGNQGTRVCAIYYPHAGHYVVLGQDAS
jgi:hypothetical protein